MLTYDDDLTRFEAYGTEALPADKSEGFVEHDGARLWHAVVGNGPAVILLHGGLGHSGNWSHQIHALISERYRIVMIDTRGHGRSTRDSRPFSYELMASDVLAVMNHLGIEKAAIVGWSDGACTGLVLAAQAPARVSGVFYFGCNMHPAGAKPFEMSPVIGRCFARHRHDYRVLSPTPDEFENLVESLGRMQRTQPNYSAHDLAGIGVPVTIVHAEHDEFIHLEHAHYLARTIPGAEFILLPGVSHFAPLQRPERFSAVVRTFLEKLSDPAWRA